MVVIESNIDVVCSDVQLWHELCLIAICLGAD